MNDSVNKCNTYCIGQKYNQAGFLTSDPTGWLLTRWPDPVVEHCETNHWQQLDSSISYLSGNPNCL